MVLRGTSTGIRVRRFARGHRERSQVTRCRERSYGARRIQYAMLTVVSNHPQCGGMVTHYMIRNVTQPCVGRLILTGGR